MHSGTPEIGSGDGETLKVGKRLADYAKASALRRRGRTLRELSRLAIDPQEAAVLKPVWQAYVETIVDIERLVLEAVVPEIV